MVSQLARHDYYSDYWTGRCAVCDEHRSDSQHYRAPVMLHDFYRQPILDTLIQRYRIVIKSMQDCYRKYLTR